jgi:hypothetical protein
MAPPGCRTSVPPGIATGISPTFPMIVLMLMLMLTIARPGPRIAPDDVVMMVVRMVVPVHVHTRRREHHIDRDAWGAWTIHPPAMVLIVVEVAVGIIVHAIGRVVIVLILDVDDLIWRRTGGILAHHTIATGGYQGERPDQQGESQQEWSTNDGMEQRRPRAYLLCGTRREEVARVSGR